MKLNKQYDHENVKLLISKHIGKPFDEITEEEFCVFTHMFYAMWIEFVDSDRDTNIEMMKMQVILKDQLWKSK